VSNTISACVTVFNESQNIRRCLDSVRWADEIVVIDSLSEDDTVAICKEYTDKVYEHEWLGYIGQKNLIRDRASCKWILFIDADEEVSPDLRDEIRDEFESGRCRAVSGYEFPRMVWYLGKWIRYGDWYPDYKLRLFQKADGHCGGIEPHDHVVITAGEVKKLIHPLYHYTYDNLFDHLGTINRFSKISALESHKAGRRCGPTDLLLRPVIRFLRAYFMKRGFMDGYHGLVIAMAISFSTFVKYAKLWEMQLPDNRHRPDD